MISLLSKKKVLLGMSGGVDSSVSAILLLEQGYEVIGAFMENWSEKQHAEQTDTATCVGKSFEECGWRTERRDAMRVAAKIGIPFLTFDFEEQYRRDVMEYLFREYAAGRTPNPDVMCNKYVKFDLFLKEADKLGCDFVATSHYARIDRTNPRHPHILKGSDGNKDQTYFLWAVDKKVLPRILFPIGDLEKPQVRAIAQQNNLPVSGKKDSTGICFVGEAQMREFLQTRLPLEPGSIVTTEGKVIGQHEGVAFYTIGQRHGLSVGGGEPYYVVGKHLETKELIVSSNYDQALYGKILTASEMNWFQERSFPFDCEARIRYRQPLQACRVEQVQPQKICVTFFQPQRAITPGQSIVFYQGEELLGGAIID